MPAISTSSSLSLTKVSLLSLAHDDLLLTGGFFADPTQVDFRNPEAFHHDINSVAGLLKTFFRELPDPLFTNQHYNDFIEAAKVEDDNGRRDAIHAVINDLPDANYATLRCVILVSATVLEARLLRCDHC